MNIYIKTTEKCNLRCKHCYNGIQFYAINMLDEESITSIFFKTQKWFV